MREAAAPSSGYGYSSGYGGGSGGGYSGGGGGSSSEQPQGVPKIYVGNLSAEVNEDRLNNFFSKYGKVVDTLIVKDRDDNFKSRGFGFVTFEDEVCTRAGRPGRGPRRTLIRRL